MTRINLDIGKIFLEKMKYLLCISLYGFETSAFLLDGQSEKEIIEAAKTVLIGVNIGGFDCVPNNLLWCRIRSIEIDFCLLP